MPQAEAKALGLYSNSGNLDGYCGFSNAVSWDYTTAAPSAGQFYLIGTIEHEITEIMGRQSMINYAAERLFADGSLPIFGAGRARSHRWRLGQYRLFLDR